MTSENTTLESHLVICHLGDPNVPRSPPPSPLPPFHLPRLSRLDLLPRGRSPYLQSVLEVHGTDEVSVWRKCRARRYVSRPFQCQQFLPAFRVPNLHHVFWARCVEHKSAFVRRKRRRRHGIEKPTQRRLLPPGGRVPH